MQNNNCLKNNNKKSINKPIRKYVKKQKINELNTSPCNQELTQGTKSLETLLLGYVKPPRLTGNTY